MLEYRDPKPISKGQNIKEAPVLLYVGKVMHARLKPFVHRFNYSVFNILIDIDRLKEADIQSRLFAINKFAPVSFYEKDHGDKTPTGLSDHIRQCLSDVGISDQPQKILLLCYPRIFGYVFNPISIYYCFTNGELTAMIYEVRNTFGGKHTYIEPVVVGQLSSAGLRQQCDKVFHVSPFISMKMRYFFRANIPDEKITFRILEHDFNEPLLSATLNVERHSLTSRYLLRELIKKPFLTIKVVAAIHFEAMKLWFKGAHFHSNPHKKLKHQK